MPVGVFDTGLAEKRKMWTDVDYSLLRSMAADKTPVPRIARILCKSISSVNHKLSRMGLIWKSVRWMDTEVELLRGYVQKRLSADEMAALLSRTPASMRGMLKKCGLYLVDDIIPQEIRDDTLELFRYLYQNRILNNVTVTANECHEWTGGRNTAGYGKVTALGKNYLVPRIVLSVHLSRPLQGKEQALHKCDNPPCCNPAHLFLGDQKANMQDMMEKGRNAAHYGTVGGKAILTDEKVLAMRHAYYVDRINHRMIAQQFGVSKNAAFYAITGRSWKHLKKGDDHVRGKRRS